MNNRATGNHHRVRRVASLLGVCVLIGGTALLVSGARTPPCPKHPSQHSPAGCRRSHKPKPRQRKRETSPRMPSPLPSAGARSCSITVSSAAAADSAVRSVRAGAVVCLAAGTYPGLALTGGHSGYVTVEAVPGQTVTITSGLRDGHGQPVAVYGEAGASHIVVHGFEIAGMVELQSGNSFIRIDHNDISGGFFGVVLTSTDCTVPNAPRWVGCHPDPKITNVIISGNRIHNIGGPSGDDALNINNYASVRVTGNELFGMFEGGNHTDCLQSTFGGSGLVFDHNYEHDNNCQGLFIKDGDVGSAIVYDNLFVRDQAHHEPEPNIQIFNVYDLTIRNNTSWPGTIDLLRNLGSARQPHATVDHNVFETFANGCCADRGFALAERDNIFGHNFEGFHRSRSDRLGRPRFVAPGSDDYRLAHAHGIGIDWRPAAQHFGP
jgi:hypothetical protein